LTFWDGSPDLGVKKNYYVYLFQWGGEENHQFQKVMFLATLSVIAVQRWQ